MKNRFLNTYIGVFIGLLIAVKGNAQENFVFYVGTYTEGTSSDGIYGYEFTPGSLEFKLRSTIKTPNPSFLALDSTRNFLFVVNELSEEDSKVRLFDLKNNSKELQSLPSCGASPCHVSLHPDKSVLAVSNYMGSISFYSFASSALTHLKSFPFKGSSVHPSRQEQSHVHSAFVSPHDGNFYVQDLGTDKIYVFEVSSKSHELEVIEKEVVELPKGSGPRHVVFHPELNHMYVLGELDGKIVHLKKEAGKWERVEVVDINSEEFKGENGAAEIRITSSGSDLYASNRLDAETITHFGVNKDGTIKKKQVYSVSGSGPRSFALSPDERFLIVANQLSNELVVFDRDKKDGSLKDTKARVKIPSPTCVVFAP